MRAISEPRSPLVSLRRTALLIVAGLLASCFVLASTASTRVLDSSAASTTLTVGIGTEPNALDPLFISTTTGESLLQLTVQTLTDYTSTGKVVPGLATKWAVSKDGLRYTFTLRTGIRFHDGTRFDAAAVKANMDRLTDSNVKSPKLGLFVAVASTTVIDPTHVQFTLSTPRAPFVAALAQRVAGILSPASLTQGGNTFARVVRPVGTGPYRFAEWVRGDHLTFTKYANYWGKKATYNTQIFRIVPDAATREALLRSGQAQVIENPPPADLASLRKNYNVLLQPTAQSEFIGINTLSKTQPLLRKVAVRQALNYAVDKQALMKQLLFGAGLPMHAPVPTSVFGYCKTGEYAYNPQKARRLLAGAGATGMTVDLLSPTGRYIADIQVANAVANYLRQVGLKVNGPRTMDFPTYLSTVLRPAETSSAELYLLGWAAQYMDSQYYMQQYNSKQAPPNGVEFTYYKNAKVDTLIARADIGRDPATRKKQYCDAQKMIWNDAPWIWLFQTRYPIVWSKKVTGITGAPTQHFRTQKARPK